MLNYEVLSLDEAVDKYNGDWINLAGKSDVNVSLLPGWLNCTSQAFRIKMSVYIQKEQDHVIGIIPFYRSVTSRLGLKLTTISTGGNLVSYHQEFITAPGHTQSVVEGFFHFLEKIKFDFFHTVAIQTDTDTYKYLNDCITKHQMNCENHLGDSSPYFKLNTNWNEVLAAKARKFRYKVNKRENLLTKNDNFIIRWYDDEDSCDELLKFIFQIEEKSWKVNDRMDITSNKVEMNFYKLLLPFLAKNHFLDASVLLIDNIPIAYNLCYLWNKQIGQLKTSYDTKFNDISPGAILMEAGFRKYFNENHNEFDFLGAPMPHKLAWSKKTRKHESIYIYGKGYKASIIFILKKFKKKLKGIQ